MPPKPAPTITASKSGAAVGPFTGMVGDMFAPLPVAAMGPCLGSFRECYGAFDLSLNDLLNMRRS